MTTITKTVRKVTHSGNDAATSFPWEFLILSNDDLTVLLVEADGTRTVLDPALYSVVNTFTEAGGAITYPLSGSPLPTGDSITIYSDTTLTQQVNVNSQNAYNPSVVMGVWNKLTIALQELKQKSINTVQLPLNLTGPLEIEAPVEGKTFIGGTSGNLVVGPSAEEISSAEAYAVSAAAAKTAAELARDAAAASAASATRLTITDVGALLGDTGLTYAAGGMTVVAGDIVRTLKEGFSYEVAAEGASDHHVTTAGGVNLYVRVGTLAAFGALADGSADASVAAAKMASAFGFVRFGLGNFRFDTSTLTVPLFFDEGGYITVPSANTLTIKSRIESPRQWIFRGGGDYSLVHDDALGIGEDSKQVHASWFGAFPSPLGTTDQAPFIQAAIDAMGNTREGVLQFDNGNYHIASAITVNRGIHIVGVGTRRTVFRAEADGYDMFTTAGAAVRFSGVQFEVQSPTLSKFDGAYIALNHDDCEVADVRFFSPTVGVRVAANNCRISHIGGTYGAAPSSPSALVNVASGSGALVEDVYALTSAYGPDALVRLGGLSDVSNVRVAGIQHILPSRSVWLDASAGNVSRVAIEGVIYNGFAGTPPDYQIDLVTSGAYSIRTVSINSVSISAHAPNGVRLLQASSGTMEDVTLDNVVVSGGSGIGVLISRTGGTLNRVRLGDSVNALARATPISYSGTMTDVKVAPAAQPNANAAVCYTYTIANDSAVAINLTRNVFTGVALVTVGSTLQGIYLIRAATSPSLTAMNTPSAGLATAASVLTGTTGEIGKATVGVQPGVIYLENRRGFPQAFHVTLLTGN